MPDKDSIQRMFLGRVVVGESVQGHSSYRTAPFKKDTAGNDTVLRYETCHADQGDFRIYVTWQDEQAYPEYLIEFSQS